MKYEIKHEISGRIRFSTCQGRLNQEDADMLLHYLNVYPDGISAKVYERTGDAVITFDGNREGVLSYLDGFSFDDHALRAKVPESAGRELTKTYKEKLISKVLVHFGCKWFMPMPVRTARIAWNSYHFIKAGLKSLQEKRIDVSVLDATAISVSLLRRDYSTAGSIIFLLGVGEILEEWTHKKSVADLARCMALDIESVWVKSGDGTIVCDIDEVEEGDVIVVYAGNTIPLDGVVVDGVAAVNQASLTGESVSVKKDEGSTVYAGTVLEEGCLYIRVQREAGSTKYEKIVAMIEASEKLKSSVENKAITLADQLVPYTLAGTVLTYLLTRNVSKALSVLMVDFSCALKLAIPITVLSAMRECRDHHITVKGGKYLEAVANADTIVFDKTGTFTKAEPTVAQVIPLGGNDRDEMLRMAACLEEHFPHSVANAVVSQAAKENLNHEEMHSEVEYVVAHGIASIVDDQRVVIGSRHFVFDDEACVVPEDDRAAVAALSPEYSHLYLAVGGTVVAVLCIEDPLREEAAEVVAAMKELGISKTIMMTGDSEHTAKAIAEKTGVDEYYAKVLPEDKAGFVERERALGRKVIMIGDGINDSPALSAADAGIAIGSGAEIAREIADITISGEDLRELVTLKKISNRLMKRIDKNYNAVIGINVGIIGLGVSGLVTPSLAAVLHNASTIGIALEDMTNLLDS